MCEFLTVKYLEMSTVIELTVTDSEHEAICLCLARISIYGQGARGTAWLYTPCLVIEQPAPKYALHHRGLAHASHIVRIDIQMIVASDGYFCCYPSTSLCRLMFSYMCWLLRIRQHRNPITFPPRPSLDDSSMTLRHCPNLMDSTFTA
jgi:hypothetical protein